MPICYRDKCTLDQLINQVKALSDIIDDMQDEIRALRDSRLKEHENTTCVSQECSSTTYTVKTILLHKIGNYWRTIKDKISAKKIDRRAEDEKIRYFTQDEPSIIRTQSRRIEQETCTNNLHDYFPYQIKCKNDSQRLEAPKTHKTVKDLQETEVTFCVTSDDHEDVNKFTNKKSTMSNFVTSDTSSSCESPFPYEIEVRSSCKFEYLAEQKDFGQQTESLDLLIADYRARSPICWKNRTKIKEQKYRNDLILETRPQPLKACINEDNIGNYIRRAFTPDLRKEKTCQTYEQCLCNKEVQCELIERFITVDVFDKKILSEKKVQTCKDIWNGRNNDSEEESSTTVSSSLSVDLESTVHDSYFHFDNNNSHFLLQVRKSGLTRHCTK